MNWNEAEKLAKTLDASDELAHFRNEFVFSDPDLIYMDGNSLGRMPKRTAEVLTHHIHHKWADRLIRSWGEGWFTMAKRVGGKIAGILGAHPDEVIIADSTTTNLHKLTLAALQAQSNRTKIVTDNLNFPSDHYVFQGAVGKENVIVVPSPDNIHGPVEGLIAALDEDVALLSLSHTVYKSGYTYDMAKLTAAAHKVGALVLWDLSHSAGSVLVNLNGANADLAVGCTYKYLNGGPGAPAFLYVRRDLQTKLTNPIPGWFSQQGQFELGQDYTPTADITRFLTGTPPTLSTAGIESGIELLLEADMQRLRTKSVQLTDFMIDLWEMGLQQYGFRLNTPRDANMRGSHVTLAHDDGWRMNRALIEQMNVLPDFRRPDNIRFGIAPIYTSFMDVYGAMARLRQVVVAGLYEAYDGEMPAVT